MTIQSRIVFSTLISILIITICAVIAWPWIHAACIWRRSTINALDLSTTSLFNNTNTSVPRIIHQTYRNIHSIPLSWQQASNSCRTLHSGYQYYFWSDEDGRRLVEKEFPSFLSTFDSYPYNIQRADVIRFVVLYIYGGIYLDLDIICLKPLDKLLNHGFVLPQTRPVGLSNDFIVSKPKHPFVLQIINNLPKHNRNFITKYPTVMFSTGPMFLTQEASSYPHRSSLNVLSAELYGKYEYNSSYSLFRHLKASSWHGNDASMIKSVYHWRYSILSVLCMCILIIYVIIYLIDENQSIRDMIYVSYSLPLFGLNNSQTKNQTATYGKYVRII